MSEIYQQMALELNLGPIKSCQKIQSLWSGYGEIVRLVCAHDVVIIKHVKLPLSFEHPKGWNTKRSHLRKINSYNVELHWYEKFASDVDENCVMPRGLKTFSTKNEWLIVMEDLNTLGYTNIVTQASQEHIKTVLEWLANFHAKHMQKEEKSLWKQGSYWHLNTRPDELESMSDEALKKAAKKIDEILER